jgi:hypothetical protein
LTIALTNKINKLPEESVKIKWNSLGQNIAKETNLQRMESVSVWEDQ